MSRGRESLPSAGGGQAAVDAHVAEADPHTQYTRRVIDEIIAGKWTFGDGTGIYSLKINVSAGTQGDIEFRDGGTLRWKERKTAGNNYGIEAYDAAGTLIDEPFAIINAAGGAIEVKRRLEIFTNTIFFRDPPSDCPIRLRKASTGKVFAVCFPSFATNTDDRNLFFVTPDADVTLTLTGDATLNQDVSTAGSPAFVKVDTPLIENAAGTLIRPSVSEVGVQFGGNNDEITIRGVGKIVHSGIRMSLDSGAGEPVGFATPGVSQPDPDQSHNVTLIWAGSDVTADRTTTIFSGDADRMLTLTGDATLDQDVSTAGSPTFVDMRVTGNIIQDGPVVVLATEQLNVSDNHIYLNNGYTSVSQQTGGHVVNNGATGLPDTVATGGFTAGVPSTSNPTVATAGAATYAVGDLVQIDTANTKANNGLYEVLSHAANVLTVRGVGVTGRVEDFTQNDFTTDTSATGGIEKVNITVNRGGTDGIWETAKGAVTGFTFSDFLTAADVGVIVQADLDVVSQAEAEAGTATDERIFTAERVKQAIDALAPGSGGPATFRASSEGESTTTSTSFQEKVKLTFTAVAADYKIEWSAETKVSSGSQKSVVRLEDDDTTDVNEANVDITDYMTVGGFIVLTLTPGSHDFDIDFRSTAGTATASIRRARITATKIVNG